MRARNDLDLYTRHAGQWWDEGSPAFRSLRAVKRHHLGLLRETWGERIAGWRIVDLGCGGGLLSIPLARAGARVVGVDLSHASLAAAAAAAEERALRCSFLRGDVVAAPLADGSADAVLLSDVLEHVERPREAVAEAARLLRPRGWLFVNTINRTGLARLLAVELAERVGLVPRGTHDPRLFVRPEELSEMARASGLEAVALRGEGVVLGDTLRTWSIHLRTTRGTRVGYNAFFRRRPA